MEALGRMTAIILAVILLIVFPIRYEALKTDITMDSYIDTELDHFYHMMKVRQEITRQMYAEFCDLLSATGVSYQIEIERYSNVIYTAESDQTFLDYDNLCYKLKSLDRVAFNENDYVLVRVQKQEKTIIDRIKNIFLPTSNRRSIYLVGGAME
ncbi:MAG: hypothetical protein PUC65_16025 [Clostridiales bacterium]|nr:hypothetical protein [Clostridiales bacterium]